MPRYRFHLEPSPPPGGLDVIELDGLDAAKCEAARRIGQALCDHPQAFWKAETYQITVSEEDGLVLFTLSIMSVLAPTISPPPHRE